MERRTILDLGPMAVDQGNREIGRILHLKLEIRNFELDDSKEVGHIAALTVCPIRNF